MKNQDKEVAVHAATVHMLETRDAASLTNEANGRLVRAATRASQIKDAKAPGRKQLAPGRSTGPRTATGKEQSSRNAIKYGIYAKAVLLKGESPTQWQRLLRGFWEYFQPVGFFEELLVEKLAMLEWRRGRMLRAENAEFERARGTAFTNTMAPRSFEETLRAIKRRARDGLLGHPADSFAIGDAVRLITQLCKSIEVRGLDHEGYSAALREVYGRNLPQGLPPGLVQVHRALAVVERDRDRIYDLALTLKQIGEEAVRVLNAEVQRLKDLQRTARKAECRRMGSQKGALARLPESAERLLRCEAHVSRELDRALSQLERQQRMRLGQPVLPPVKVELST